MVHPLSVDGARELVVVERSGVVESRHMGVAVVVDGDGAVIESVGDVEAFVYPRSSLKPLQATTVLRLGAELEGVELALATASHVGTPAHVEVVERMLARAGLSDDSLACPRDWPSDPDAAAHARVSGEPRRITMNCSGKHAGFLAACVASGWSTDDHLDVLHPLQRAILDTVEEFCGESVAHIGVDGCGAPVFAVSTVGLARGIGRVTRGAEIATRRLVAAVRQHPWAIGGERQPDSRLIAELGLFAKLGAEGVIVVGDDRGRAAAVKVLDGNARAATPVALELLARAGVIERVDADRVAALVSERVLGGGKPVGALRVVV